MSLRRSASFCFVWSIYARRTVKDAFYLQEAISTAFTEENFGDYNEKTFFDVGYRCISSPTYESFGQIAPRSSVRLASCGATSQ